MNIRTLGVFCGILSGFFLGYDGYCCSVLIAHRPHGAGAIHFFDDGRHDRRSFRHFYCYQAERNVPRSHRQTKRLSVLLVRCFGPPYAGQLLCLCEVFQRRNGCGHCRNPAFLHHGSFTLCRCHADGFADSLLRSGARRRVFDDDQRRFLNTVFRLADAFGRLRRPAL